ncbi:hypothetical protein CA13_59230 [Planctomycetes bacterium CA13]|uniref:Ice-binding protein C-terminal domain-containing protein n=1 Tax=Novipirellula herctigrandis TaxID=2527986 RepID=A0A5C5ZBB1_9BACT|nr:hypothetical protein CA13_59230 [Planctomycetes bacterium CA13]
MNRISFLLAAAIICVAVPANGAVLVDFDAGNVGNGKLLSAGAALVNETLPGNIFFNADGRALAQYGNDGYNGGGVGSASSISDFTNNAGVQFSGWTVYRGPYSGGNNSFGLLENGGRMGDANVTGDGHAFANAGEFFMLSDPFSQAIADGDTINISYQGGSDNGTADISTYLVLDGANSGTLFDATTGLGSSEPQIVLTSSGAGFTAASTVQLLFVTSTSDNSRALMDDVRFEVASAVPEPSSFALLALVGGAVVTHRRRKA